MDFEWLKSTDLSLAFQMFSELQFDVITISLVIFHVLLISTIYRLRHHAYCLFSIFVFNCTIVIMGEYINEFLANLSLRNFKENYFDNYGAFYTFSLTIPLLLQSMIILFCLFQIIIGSLRKLNVLKSREKNE
ncbi:hypothetical protein SNEBB_010873 [Seison nebaliae]|nr:hypothetical protein SNEBB_010873 [Seison nebaliae]